MPPIFGMTTSNISPGTANDWKKTAGINENASEKRKFHLLTRSVRAIQSPRLNMNPAEISAKFRFEIPGFTAESRHVTQGLRNNNIDTGIGEIFKHFQY
jgi:hypothetical protein